jgi:hypothetical protein
MIFKQGSCADELYDSMDKAQLEAVAKEEQREGELILEAMRELNAAAECFEKAGRTARAKEVTQVMMSLAEDNDDSDEKPKKTSEDEVRKVFMFFGFGPEDLKGLELSSDGDTGDGE